MKRILFGLALVFITQQTFSQDNFTISKVIHTNEVGKNMIYVAINDWFATTYNSANDVIQMADKEAGIIIGNGSTDYTKEGMMYMCYGGWIKYTIKVYMKGNRFKVDITNFRHSVKPSASPLCALGLITNAENYTDKGMSKKYHNKVWNDIKEYSTAYAESLFLSLEKRAKNIKKEEVTDDW